MKTKIFFATLLVAVFCLASLSHSQVPQMINYQGTLTDALENPIDGNKNMTFRIYDVANGGTALWTEAQNNVPVEDGVFNVLLGSVTPIPFSVFNGPTKYLGVTVAPDPEMTPRKEIVSVPYAYRAAMGDNDWTFLITDGGDTTLQTGGKWGIARYGNILYGNADSTHVNFGVACTTGTNGQNWKYCTVGGGLGNKASGTSSIVGGGSNNTASGGYATVEGGNYNTASGSNATVGGGYNNAASNVFATVGGGGGNTASGPYATVPGGTGNTAAGDISFAAGWDVNVNSSADYTFAFGRNFTTSTPNAVIFHNSVNPIKVGIGTTSPTERLDVAGTARMTGFQMPTGAIAGYVLTSDAGGVGTWQTAPGGGAGGWTDDGTVVRLTNSTDKVGIGTTNPATPLEVEKSTAGANEVVAYFSNPSDVANTEVSIDLGIGTSSPTAWRLKGTANNLQISNTAMSTPGLVLNSNSTYNLDVAGTAQMTGFKMPTGAIAGYVLTSDAGGAGTWQAAGGGGGSDKDWVYPQAEGGANPRPYLYTYGYWGIARKGNTLWGSYDSTHVNLGVACTTGANGYDYKYCTVGGGVDNAAVSPNATVGGGYRNTAGGDYGTVGGGDQNATGGDSTTEATVAGGTFDTAWAYGATVGGGYHNVAGAQHSTIPGGYDNRVNEGGDYSLAAGKQVTINAANTFAFGNNFSTSQSHAVIFHDTNTPIKVGIGTASPQGALDVTSTTGAFIVPRMTTVQRDALTPVNGMIIYNTTTNQFNFRENGAWVTK